MVLSVLKDPWTYIASATTGFFISLQWLAQWATPLVAFVGACIGLVGIIIGVRQKLLQNKLLEQELKIKNQELRNARRH